MGKGWALAALLFAATAFPARAQEAVTIAGRVANGTPGGGAVAGDEVAVAAVRDGQAVAQQTARVGADGRFQAGDLPVGTDLSYAARVVHDGVAYWSDSLKPQNGAFPAAAVTVYEKTADASKVAVE